MSDERIPLIGLSDPLTSPTGFGRVARELFSRLSSEKFRMAYVSRGWVGSSKFPGVTCYAEWKGSRFCQDAFAAAAHDFAPKGPFVLWTLMDPFQTHWISNPVESPLATADSKDFLGGHRERMAWVAHFPIDGTGVHADQPPRSTDTALFGADILVAMSEWGKTLTENMLHREVRLIYHAVEDNFIPMDQGEARKTFDLMMQVGMAKGLAQIQGLTTLSQDREFLREVNERRFRLEDRFTVLCVMANRERKLWWDVLRGFKMLTEQIPQARFIGVCGDRTGLRSESWPLMDICRDLDLHLAEESTDPNVLLLDFVTERADQPENYGFRLLHGLSDVSILISGGEGFGLPQLEAHACGRPCICGDYSASSELAVHSRELIAPRSFWTTDKQMVRRPVYSPRDIADRLVYAFKNPGWRKEVGAAGVEQAARHRWDRILPLWEDVFAEAAALIGRSKEPVPIG